MPQDFNSSYYYSLGSVGQSKTSTLVVEGNFYLTSKGSFWIYTNTENTNNNNRELSTNQKNGTEPILLGDYINTLTKIWIPDVANDFISYPNKVSIGSSLSPGTNKLLVSGNSKFNGVVQITDKLMLDSSIDFNNSSIVNIIGNNSNALSFQSNSSDLMVFDTSSSPIKITISGDLHIPNNTGHYNSLEIGNGYGSSGTTITSNGDISTNGNIMVDGNITIGGDVSTGTTLNSNGVIETKNTITCTNSKLTSLTGNKMIYLDSSNTIANLSSDILTLDTNNKLSIIDNTISLTKLTPINENNLIIGRGNNNNIVNAPVSSSSNIILSYNSSSEIQLDFNQTNANSNLDDSNLEKILTYSGQKLKWDYLTNIINARPSNQSFTQTTPIKITGLGGGTSDTFLSILATALPTTNTQGLMDIIWDSSSTTDNTDRYMLKLINNNYDDTQPTKKKLSFIDCLNKNTADSFATIFNVDYSGNLSTAGNILPISNNISNLGSATTQFKNIYLGNTSLIDFNNNNFTITYNNNELKFNTSNVSNSSIEFSEISMNNVNIKSGKIAAQLLGTADAYGGNFTTFSCTGETSLATDGGSVNISKSGVMTTILGTLNINQDTSLNTTLLVSGITTLTSDLIANGGNITNATTTAENNIFATSTGKTTLGGGAIDMSAANSATKIYGSLNVVQETSLDNTLLVSGITTLTSDLIANGGNITNATTTAENNIFATSTGKTTLGGGAIDMSAANSATKIYGSLNVVQETSLDNTLLVSGITTLTSDLIANGGNITNATTTAENNIFATSTGKTTLGGGAIDMSAANSATKIYGSLNVVQETSLDNTLLVSGITTLTSDLIANGGNITNATTTAENNIFATSTGKTTLGGGAIDMSAANSATKIYGSLNVVQETSLDTTLLVSGVTTLTTLQAGQTTLTSATINATTLPTINTQGLMDIIWDSSSNENNTDRYMLKLINNNYDTQSTNKKLSFINCVNKGTDDNFLNIFNVDYSGNLSTAGNTNINGSLIVNSSITASSFVIGNADINENDLEKLDDITNGIAAANKALVADENKGIDGLGNISTNKLTLIKSTVELPDNPNDGDLVYNNTNLYIRIGSEWKIITMSSYTPST